MIKFISLKEKLKNNFFPLLVVYGNDLWLKEKAIENIVGSLDITVDINISRFEQTSDFDAVFMACATLPFMDRYRAVIAELIVPQGRKAQELKERLEKFAAYPQQSCCLIIVCDNPKPFETVRGAEKVDCSRLDTENVVRWITSYVRLNKGNIDRNTALKIAEYCLNDMARVSTETEKLVGYSPDVTQENVQLLVHKDMEYVVFDLGKAIAVKNVEKSLSMVSSLIEKGEEPRSLFSVLYNFYRRMYYVRTSEGSNESKAELLGVKPYALRYVAEVAAGYRPVQLKKALNLFLDADAKIKRFFNDRETLEYLVLQLLQL